MRSSHSLGFCLSSGDLAQRFPWPVHQQELPTTILTLQGNGNSVRLVLPDAWYEEAGNDRQHAKRNARDPYPLQGVRISPAATQSSTFQYFERIAGRLGNVRWSSEKRLDELTGI